MTKRELKYVERLVREHTRMRTRLLDIAKSVPFARLRKQASDRNFALSYEEYIEMAHENLQEEARVGVKGIREARVPV